MLQQCGRTKAPRTNNNHCKSIQNFAKELIANNKIVIDDEGTKCDELVPHLPVASDDKVTAIQKQPQQKQNRLLKERFIGFSAVEILVKLSNQVIFDILNMENTIKFETMLKPQNRKTQTATRPVAVPSLRVTCNFGQCWNVSVTKSTQLNQTQSCKVFRLSTQDTFSKRFYSFG